MDDSPALTYRKPSLDTFRALAILMVLLAHSVLAYGPTKLTAPLQFGGHGVDLFFVLSGWLLGSQLIKEQKKTSRINVTKFWGRRWLRTIPPYLTVLLFTLGQLLIQGKLRDSPIAYFFFIQNYSTSMDFFYVSWSLCVEEQFYLIIAPFLFISLNLGKRLTLILLVLLSLTPFILRQIGLYNESIETHVSFDGCVIGVLLAFFKYHYTSFWERLIGMSSYLAMASTLILLSLLLIRYFPSIFSLHYDKLIVTLCFSSWIIWGDMLEQYLKVLSFPSSRFIATRAYAIYLLHPEVLAILRKFTDDLSFGIFLALTVIICFLAADIFYRIVEKPAMNLRYKIQYLK